MFELGRNTQKLGGANMLIGKLVVTYKNQTLNIKRQ